MPELGQMCFGNAWSEHSLNSSAVANYLNSLREEVETKVGEYEPYSNEVFEFREYYWGDCACGFDELDCKWSDEHTCKPGCLYRKVMDHRESTGQSLMSKEFEAWLKKEGIPMEGCMAFENCCTFEPYQEWRKTHDHAKTCGVVAPNFLHKKSGAEVRWYKHIGRSMTSNVVLSDREWKKLIREAEESLKEAS